MNFFAPHIMEWNKLDRKIHQSKLFSLGFYIAFSYTFFKIYIVCKNMGII